MIGGRVIAGFRAVGFLIIVGVDGAAVRVVLQPGGQHQFGQL